jgi:hypothetical protein|nr:MAG TPA: hypothetical protein [Caudoviricetes sp.]
MFILIWIIIVMFLLIFVVTSEYEIAKRDEEWMRRIVEGDKRWTKEIKEEKNQWKKK